MSTRTLPMMLAIVLTALACFIIEGSTAQGAQRSTPTPAVMATATPCTAIPAAPSALEVDLSAMRWTDNSDNEEGFLIDLTVCGFTPLEQHLHYQLAADTTTFLFPPEYQRAKSECYCSYLAWKVTAFNACGQASTFLQTGIPMCLPPATATPVTVAMPGTGARDPGAGAARWWAALVLAGGAASLAGGTAVLTRSAQKRLPS